jgi:hypothetical protein
MNKNNPYGYKVGYRENGNRLFIRHFMTYTYKQARFSLRFYRKYPQRNRETNRPIIDPFWEIKPITKKEYLAGIWDELPFKWLRLNFRCKLNHPYVFFLSRAYRRIGQAQISTVLRKIILIFLALVDIC